jgi:hypothetical protein
MTNEQFQQIIQALASIQERISAIEKSNKKPILEDWQETILNNFRPVVNIAPLPKNPDFKRRNDEDFPTPLD